MANYYRDVVDLLKENDCFFVRQGKGSHEIWQSRRTGKRFPVPYNLGTRHTANGILKDAKIDKKL